jgi:hypothetical protein
MMSNDKFEKSHPIPFARGISWLVQSLALLRMQLGRLLLIAVFMQVILGLTQLPLIGMLIIISVPALSAGVLEAFEVTSRGGQPGLNLLFRPLTSASHSGRLFLLGLLVFAVGILSMSLMLSGSEELFDPEMISRIEQGDIDALTQLDQGSLGKMVMAFLVGIAISGTLSYLTIPLIWFGDRRLGPALVEGIKALIVHWKPFLMLALGLFVVSIPVIIVSGVLVGMTGSGRLVSAVVMVCILMLLLAFQMLLFATEYCAFRDIFGIGERSGPPSTEDDSQLVA